MIEQKLWEYTLGVCLLLGFVGFGYMLYQWVNAASLLVTAIFIGTTVVSLGQYTKIQQKARENEVHDQYERQKGIRSE